MGASTKQLDKTLIKETEGDAGGDGDSDVTVEVSVPENDPILELDWSDQVELMEKTEQKGEKTKEEVREAAKTKKGGYVTNFSTEELDKYLTRLTSDYKISEDVSMLRKFGVTRVDAVRAAIYSLYRKKARTIAHSSLRDFYQIRGSTVRLESDIRGEPIEHPLRKYNRFDDRIDDDNVEIKSRPRKSKTIFQMATGVPSEFEEEDDSAVELAKLFSNLSGEIVTVEKVTVATNMAGKKDKALGIGTTTSLAQVVRASKDMKFEKKSLALMFVDATPVNMEEALRACPVITEFSGFPLTDEKHLFTGSRLYKRYKLYGIGPFVKVTLSQLLKTISEHPEMSVTEVCERLMSYNVRVGAVSES